MLQDDRLEVLRELCLIPTVALVGYACFALVVRWYQPHADSLRFRDPNKTQCRQVVEGSDSCGIANRSESHGCQGQAPSELSSRTPSEDNDQSFHDDELSDFSDWSTWPNEWSDMEDVSADSWETLHFDVSEDLDGDDMFEGALAGINGMQAPAALLSAAWRHSAVWTSAAIGRLHDAGWRLSSADAIAFARLFGSKHRADLALDLWQRQGEALPAESDGLYGAVLEAAASCEDMETAARAARLAAWRAPPGAEGRDALVVLARWLARRQEVSRAWACYRAAQRLGTAPDIATHRAIIIANVRRHDMERAEAVFRDLLSCGLGANFAVCSAMVCGFCIAGHVEKAAEYLTRARQHCLVPSASLFDAVLEICACSNAEATAAHVFSGMEADGVRPSSKTLAAAVRLTAGDAMRAVATFNDLQDRGGEADDRAYCALISVCLGSGRLDLARSAIDQMLAAGLVPSGRSASALLAALGRAGDFEAAARVAGAVGGRLEPRAAEDLLRLLGRKGLSMHLGMPLLENLQASGVELSDATAVAVRRETFALRFAKDSGHAFLRKRRAERQRWRDFKH